jgi:DNA mismatch repair protein MutS
MATCAHTLLGVLDSTVSPMGGRLLRRWLHRPAARPRRRRPAPPCGVGLIDARAGELLRDAFRSLGDLERILSRVALRSARPRDLSTLRDGLSLLPSVRSRSCPDWIRRACRRCTQPWANTRRPRACCARPSSRNPRCLPATAAPSPTATTPNSTSCARLSTNADQFLVELEAREREATGIATLKVGYNRVHGYYIEISKGQSDQGAGALHAPADADRRGALHHRGTEGLRGQGAVRARTLAVAREAAVRRRARPAQRGASSRCAAAPPR